MRVRVRVRVRVSNERRDLRKTCEGGKQRWLVQRKGGKQRKGV